MQIQARPHVVRELEIGGRKPFSDWFRRLKDKEAKAAILGRLDRIAEYGNFGEYRYLGDHVLELKILWGLDIGSISVMRMVK